jgi:hypothetical protein
MRSLSASELLAAWERGLGQSLVQRALALLAAVYPEAPADDLLGLTIGRRDAQLLALRERLFGPEMACVAVCPQCAGQLDLSLNAADMRSAFTPDPATEIEFSAAGYQLQLRRSNSEDLIEVLDRNDPDAAKESLFERCLLSARLEGDPVAARSLPEEVVEAAWERMSQADPLADIQLAMVCPSCGHSWKAPFDIVSFLWREIESLAARLMREVHTLASAYGWHERDILALSPVRRQFYLALLGA